MKPVTGVTTHTATDRQLHLLVATQPGFSRQVVDLGLVKLRTLGPDADIGIINQYQSRQITDLGPGRVIIEQGIRDIKKQLDGAVLRHGFAQGPAPQESASLHFALTEATTQPAQQCVIQCRGEVLGSVNEVSVRQTHHQLHFDAYRCFTKGDVEAEQRVGCAFHARACDQAAIQRQAVLVPVDVNRPVKVIVEQRISKKRGKIEAELLAVDDHLAAAGLQIQVTVPEHNAGGSFPGLHSELVEIRFQSPAAGQVTVIIKAELQAPQPTLRLQCLQHIRQFWRYL